MKTYLVIWFSSNGVCPSEVTQRLMSLGFEPMQGGYDFVYKWESGVGIDQVLKFGDKVFLSLQGTGAMFKLETI
ncbi:MAG: hypothetical protein PHV51_06420 [Methanosarcinaceae archaeon]|nr:hypothetical protein [Methanosarcinaceae archaeon]MDD4497767.1 hypothetical protein [Methanosarcinaceae archaeon]